jgi:acyl-CoA synthetase (AMP-forming)/AMP-acid ligase II
MLPRCDESSGLPHARIERYVFFPHANPARHVGPRHRRPAVTALEQGGERADVFPHVLPAQGAVPDTGRNCATLADVLRWRAGHQPDRLGYRFLPDGASREETLTYRELDRRARAIAAALRSLGATRRPTLLVYLPGLEFICAWFGCAYAGAVAVVVHPPHAARAGGGRFASDTAAIVSDARPAVALTTAAILAGLPAAVAPSAQLRAAHWLATDAGLEPPAPERATEEASSVSGDDLAFLQYTSGSTTAPRGVMVTHGNLMHNLRAIEATFSRPSDRGSVSWLPPYHDMGLIGGILAPLYLGSPVTLLPPVAIVQRPLRWLQAITRFRAAVSGGPNFAYDLCVRGIRPEQRAGLDLSSWRVAFNGAEPVNPRTIREFTAYFAPCGFEAAAFKPCYGLAEATLLVSVSAMLAPPRIQAFRQSDLERHHVTLCAADAEGARSLASCGQPVATTAIVDPETSRRCPPGRVGEIWVAGLSVARGYCNHPADTEETFNARLFDGTAADGPFLRTGDLGFLLDGDLFVTGRLKDLIIIDGTNHYPQDIERTVGGSHPLLEATDCAAFSVEVDGREALVVVAAVQRRARATVADLRRAIRTAVAEQHGVRIHDIVLIERGHMPRTASGKVRRRACRLEYLARTLPILGAA